MCREIHELNVYTHSIHKGKGVDKYKIGSGSNSK